MKLQLLVLGLALQAGQPASGPAGIYQVFLNGKPYAEGRKEIGR